MPETLLLVTMPRPEGGGWWDAPWFLALGKAGAVVEVQPVPRSALPGWLEKRLARQKQSAAREVLDYLADRVEGNLLAAHQELQKLALLAPAGELSLDVVREAVADVARYDTLVAAEALATGDTARYLRVLDGLRGEGEATTHLLFTISSRRRARRRARGARSRCPAAGMESPSGCGSPPHAPRAPARLRAERSRSRAA
jgi:DNA polymerase-3 subunit delta